MADQNFFDNVGPFTLAELADLCGARLERAEDPGKIISDVQPLESAAEGHVSFFSNPKYLNALKATKASACILPESYVKDAPEGVALLVSSDSYKAYARVSQKFYPEKRGTGDIHETAVISPSARLGKNVSVGPGTVIEDEVVIGDNTAIGALCFIGKGCNIGVACRFESHISVRCCHMGDNVALNAGVRIGEDGFGFAPDPGGHIKIPQLGRVMIGSNVEIGANTTIDRGAGPDTVIGDNCWIDNLCQIGHNVRLGQGCIIVSQTGISGSTTLEDFVVLGGQVGLAGHINIGAGAQVTAKAGVMTDIPSGQVYAGIPASPRKEFFRSVATLRQLAKGKGKSQ